MNSVHKQSTLEYKISKTRMKSKKPVLQTNHNLTRTLKILVNKFIRNGKNEIVTKTYRNTASSELK